MKKNIDIPYDLENSPLKIKTDSAIGSGHLVRVIFRRPAGQYAGVIILLRSTPWYNLNDCQRSYTEIPTSLPEDHNRIWKITKTSDPLGILIHCNDKEILNFQFSDTTCTERSWRSQWGQEMKRINFYGDTASDYYYHLPGKVGQHDRDRLAASYIKGMLAHVFID